MSKKILQFFGQKNTGVNYYRCLLPVKAIDSNFRGEYHIDIVDAFNFSDTSSWDSYDLIHFHTTLVDFKDMERVCKAIQAKGIKLVLDIDDYWVLPKTHPRYEDVVHSKFAELIKKNISLVDYVTTTTEAFAKELRKYNKNVVVLQNAIPFKERKRSESEMVRLGYVGGSSHLYDLMKLKGSVNSLLATTSNFSFTLAGFDLRGKMPVVEMNEAFVEELKSVNLWNVQFLNYIKKYIRNIYEVKEIPKAIREKYKDNYYKIVEKQIPINQNVWLEYERLVTDNYRLVKDQNYLKYLQKYTEDESGLTIEQENQFGYRRVFSKPITSYRNVYDDIDVVVAPLALTDFNRMKSELKLIEAIENKLPIVCSNIEPYNHYGVNEKNCLLVEYHKTDKKWTKALKKLIESKAMREDLGNQLYDDLKDTFDINNVAKLRKEFYDEVLSK